jgi:hypothetical protein
MGEIEEELGRDLKERTLAAMVLDMLTLFLGFDPTVRIFGSEAEMWRWMEGL